jgi:heme/copper-type cytochrome/quinol oxidase subunit 2
MLAMWVLALPIWLVFFLVLYVALKYREARTYLAGAFFVSSGDVLVSVTDWHIASDCAATRRDCFR